MNTDTEAIARLSRIADPACNAYRAPCGSLVPLDPGMCCAECGHRQDAHWLKSLTTQLADRDALQEQVDRLIRTDVQSMELLSARDEQLATVTRERDEARSLLSRLEWSAGDAIKSKCPVCQGVMPFDADYESTHGHEVDCPLAAILSRAQSPTEETP